MGDIFVEEDNQQESSNRRVEKNSSKNDQKLQEEKQDQTINNKEESYSSEKYYYVELPSEGKLDYPHTVDHRDVLWKDQKILSSSSEATFTKTLNKVIKSILNDPDWFEDMTISDRDFLLVWIFANNFSPKKTVEITCSECGHVDKVDYNVTDLDVNNLSEDYVEPFRIPIKNGDNIWVRLARVKDELSADEFLRKSENKGINENLESLILYQTIDPGYELPLKAKIKWIEQNLTAKDMAIIREFHEYFSYGINDVIEHTCSECGEVTQGRFPFRLEELFTPSVQNDFTSILQANKGT